MPQSGRARRARLILQMDKDRVGLVSGAFFGFIVLVTCVAWSGAAAVEIVYRVGLTFIVAYLAAFFLVHVIQRVAGPELKPKRSVRLGSAGSDAERNPAGVFSGDEQQ